MAGGRKHSQVHSDLQDAIEAIEAKLGINSSAVSSSVDYILAAALVSITARLVAANNLSDLANVGMARTNLGLGTLATQSGTFSGTSSGTNTGDQTSVSGSSGSCTGNAATATLATSATAAAGLLSATTTVVVSAATAPTNGQVLTATGGTAATWQTPAAGGPQLNTANTWTAPNQFNAGLTTQGIAQATVSNVALTSNVVTITTSSPHGFQVGQWVVVSVFPSVAVDKVFLIASVPTTTTFTYALVHADIGSTVNTGTAIVCQSVALDSTGVIQSFISAAGLTYFYGAITASNLTGTNTGDQDLSGYALLVSPSFTTPALGTPSSGNLSSCTGYAYANLTGAPAIPAAGIPTASVGNTAVNGVATTFQRSDAAPALSASIQAAQTLSAAINMLAMG